MIYQRNPNRRFGSALVETAAVAGVFMLILLGVMEYCRFLFFMQLSENAAREGTRYAVVNTNDSNLTADTQAVVNKYMNNMGNNMKNFAILVYQADSSGSNVGSPQSTGFGNNICVQVDYDYSTLTPSFMFLNKTIHVTLKTYMCSEAN
jgi:Flp pilus assembly protein TadG